jgi:hypothetical protein
MLHLMLTDEHRLLYRFWVHGHGTAVVLLHGGVCMLRVDASDMKPVRRDVKHVAQW